MKPLRIGIASLCIVLVSSGCSEQPRKEAPTEQEIHASDSGDGSGTPGRHPYQCDDNRALLIDFKNDGLALELRRDAKAAPIVLTAPAPGLQYVGDTMSATFSGNEIKIEEADKRSVLCRKATSL
ncbi:MULTISPECIES: hypothetical protein [unclassified Novosphingobium]|uniref:hypothetical protein n=1 Tax=unclassified Novosphingobium TaxID=2644732 RepID=UPI001DD6BC4F|nr:MULTISPECIES: hypothetical protein [unclassified Novosphingobium]MBX9664864.1 hypothetical protein [Novosphingobium sp.]HQS95417.1 hypothetical protein [Novosphingobium sp.]